VDAVFDHLGGPSLSLSWRLLRHGGVLVSYALASKLDAPGSVIVPFLSLMAKVLWWNAAPNGRSAHFYNLWSGRSAREAFQRRLHHALTEVLSRLAEGQLRAQVGGIVPLERAAEAFRLAESGSVVGKVVLVPTSERAVSS
jgi:NADPH2:quinone reductase